MLLLELGNLFSDFIRCGNEKEDSTSHIINLDIFRVILPLTRLYFNTSKLLRLASQTRTMFEFQRDSVTLLLSLAYITRRSSLFYHFIGIHV
jgi:hypothetical protein